MQYRYLSQLGSHYNGEEGTPGVRRSVLQGVEAQLKAAMVDLANAERPLARPLPALPATVADPRRVAAAREAETRAAEFIARRATQVAHYRRLVSNIREVLVRQGCEVRADGSIVWERSMATVVYDHDPVLRNMTRIHLSGGRLFSDEACTRPLDTRGMVTQFSGPGFAIFVMSERGNLHVASHSVGHRHHSSLLAGESVAAAGELICRDGVLRWLSNKSGHYRPGVGHLLQVLHQLQKKGIPMTFPLMVLPSGKNYGSVGAFLDELRIAGEPDYELDKLMAYKEHLTDAVLGSHRPTPWRWRLPGEPAGVYVVINRTPVPHRDVRKWLKSVGRDAGTNVQSGAGAAVRRGVPPAYDDRSRRYPFAVISSTMRLTHSSTPI